MNKKIQKTLLSVIAVLGIGFLLSSPASVLAQPINPLVIQFENATSLFQETNLLPGHSITRWIKVTNNSGSTQKIAIEAINYTKPIPMDNLARALDIVIKNDSADLYGGESAGGTKSLYDFYNDGENYLSDLTNSATAQYDITISFPAEKGDEWQTKTTGFDILIGFQGTDDYGETGGGTIGGATIGGGSNGNGGGLPPGLTITNEAAVTTDDTATITWITSYPATTQIVYSSDIEPHTFDLYAANYGYSHAYPDPEDITKVTGHTVIVPDLTPGATYYYRAISHASPPSISIERTFTTKPARINYPHLLSPKLPDDSNTLPGAADGLNLPGSDATGELLPNALENPILPPAESLAYLLSGNDAVSPVFEKISGNGISKTSEEELSFLLGGDEEEDEKNGLNFLTGAILPAFKFLSKPLSRILLLLALFILYLLLYKKRKQKKEKQLVKY